MIEFKNVSFTYAGAGRGGVKNLNLEIPKGQLIVLCGESGCGKTTITRLINGLIPHFYDGEISGQVLVNGQDASAQPLYDTAKYVGSVFQNPRSQFFNVDTTSEIAFGCENFGIDKEEIQRRIQYTVESFKMQKLMGKSIFNLSGGEKQKIACASVSAMEPDIFVMDEPSSNLDISAIMELKKILAFWKKQGKTIIISEHRLFYLNGLADRFLYVKDGEIHKEYTKEEFEYLTEKQRSEMGLRAYSLKDIHLKEQNLSDEEKTNEENINQENTSEKAMIKHGKNLMFKGADKKNYSQNTDITRNKIMLKNFHFAHKNQPETLHIEDCSIPTKRIVAIIGNNGAGKSTFARCFCGLEKHCGNIVWNGKVMKPKDRLNSCYIVMQEVNHQLFTESVCDEVKISMADESTRKTDDNDKDEGEWKVENILKNLDLMQYKDKHPMSLSGGQKQRTAIASAIASNRLILFFDEPTSGLDLKHMREVSYMLKKLQEGGETIYVITHDLELIADCCSHIIHLENGNIVDQYPLNKEGLLKIKNYFFKGEAFR